VLDTIPIPPCCDSTDLVCEDFNDLTPTNTYNTTGVGNWTALATDIGIFSGSWDGTPYLRANDNSGGSWVYNNSADYSGNWLDKGCELCFDYNFISADGCPGITRISALYIYQGTDPSTSGSATRAVFKLHTPIVAGSGWHQICVPIDTCSSGTVLPSNSFGYWDWNAGGTDCVDFTNLLTNVSGIGFPVDNSCGVQTETHGWDNFCFSRCCDSPQWEYCDPVIDLGTTTLSSGTVHAQNEVISSGTVPQGTNVSLKAGQKIQLNSGFNTDTNANLRIHIEDCVPD